MNVPKNESPCWIAVTDNRWGRLVRCQRIASGGAAGRWHAEEVETIKSAWEEHPGQVRERHDPSRPEVTPAGPVLEHHPGWGHKKEEETKRFAHEVAAWLDKRCHELGILHISVFAPDHFLGPLRAAWPQRLRLILTEHAADLTHLRVPELLEHPTVAAILGAEATV